MELFGCIRIVCVTKAFMYKLQTRVLYRVIWSFWEFMQVTAVVLLGFYLIKSVKLIVFKFDLLVIKQL